MKKKSITELVKLISEKKIDYKTSREIFDEIMRKNPKELNYKRSYADAIKRSFDEIDKGNLILEDLEKDYLELIKNNSNDWETYMDLGYMCEWGLKDYKKSLKYFEKARDILSEDFTNDNLRVIFFKISLIKERFNDFEGAIECFDTTINTYEYLISLPENKKNKKVLNEFTIKLSDEYKYRGHVKRRIYNEGFIKDYKKAVELNSHHAFWLTVVADYFYKKGDFKKYYSQMIEFVKFKDFFGGGNSWFGIGYKLNKKRVLFSLPTSLKKFLIHLICNHNFKLAESISRDIYISFFKSCDDYESFLDKEFINIYSLLFSYKKFYEHKYKSDIKKELSRRKKVLKELKDKSDAFLKLNFEESDHPYGYTRENLKLKDDEKTLIIRAMRKLNYDLILMSELFKRSPYLLFSAYSKEISFDTDNKIY